MNTQSKSKGKIWLIALLLIVLIGKIIIWDNKDNKWLIEDLYTKPPFDDKLTTASEYKQISYNNSSAVEFTDATKINYAIASDYRRPETTKELIDAVKYAKENKKKISMSGARHSSNGQNLGDIIHLDMMNYDDVVSIEKENNLVTVQSGITWKALQSKLGKEGLAIKVMQDSNIFTVGGSIGTNIHGKDVRYGSFIESIDSFKLINAQGIEVNCSRAENYNLFKNVVGGFGMFGVLTEVRLKVEKNTVYDFVVTNNSADVMVDKFDEFIAKGSDMVEGHFSISKANLMKEVQIYYFTPNKNNKQIPDDITGENSIWIRKLVYRLSRVSEWGKDFRWWMQKNVSVSVDPQLSSRNGAMAAPFRVLQIDNPDSTDVLQEYFVPRSNIQSWLKEYRELLAKYDMNLINCGVRRVNKDTEARVSYATEEMYGFVCYYNINKNMSLNDKYLTFTRQMISNLIATGGKYYLAYNIHDNTDLIKQMYPSLNELLIEKQKLDPDGIFDNKFYQKFDSAKSS
jgi:decaprenylphospho-beta-D-ribofuranose 2-oxidase